MPRRGLRLKLLLPHGGQLRPPQARPHIKIAHCETGIYTDSTAERRVKPCRLREDARKPKPLVLPEVHLQEQVVVPQTFDPPVLDQPPILDALPAVGPRNPAAPVVLHARHIHNKLLSSEGLLTIYGKEYRFRELKSDREFIGLTSDLLSHCQPQKASCIVQVMASGHKEPILVTLAPELWNGREQ